MLHHHFSACPHSHRPLPHGRYAAHLSKRQVTVAFPGLPCGIPTCQTSFKTSRLAVLLHLDYTHNGPWLTLIGGSVSRASEPFSMMYQPYRLAGVNKALCAIYHALPGARVNMLSIKLTSHFVFSYTPRRRSVGTSEQQQRR